MNKWEYKIIYKPEEEELNLLGKDGWELVTGNVYVLDDYCSSSKYILKRLLEEDNLDSNQ